MAKCRECDGNGSDPNRADLFSERCQSCAGTGEVSQSPEHMVSQSSLQPTAYTDSISLLRACRRHLRMLDEESSYDLAEEISDHFKTLGIE